ncbi:TPA: hypothetical protein N0F65_009808 [Lagenidium giganteum]|uniref:Uncharacterized protein n=1 Tax=Lagenidium giganteum TaxID=4803 RepID=A0AAV2YJU9_9STRA|nr:TPA: hypothetical protein N0F65_009808 [Lagenidium giganteum]
MRRKATQTHRGHCIAPVLIILCNVFDYVELDVDKAVDGDICIVQAKKSNFDQRVGQAPVGCEVVADREGRDAVYGVVIGFITWHFIRSRGNSVMMDVAELCLLASELPRTVRTVCDTIYSILSAHDDE